MGSESFPCCTQNSRTVPFTANALLTPLVHTLYIHYLYVYTKYLVTVLSYNCTQYYTQLLYCCTRCGTQVLLYLYSV